MMTTWLGFHSCLCCLQLASKFPAQLTFRNAEVESHFLWCHINIWNTHWSSLRIYKEYITTHVSSSIRFIFRQKLNNERTTEERGKFIYVRITRCPELPGFPLVKIVSFEIFTGGPYEPTLHWNPVGFANLDTGDHLTL